MVPWWKTGTQEATSTCDVSGAVIPAPAAGAVKVVAIVKRSVVGSTDALLKATGGMRPFKLSLEKAGPAARAEM